MKATGGTFYHPVQGDVTIQMKAFEMYFPVVVFITLKLF